MAEVGQRLGIGVYRLSAVRSSQSRTVCAGESPGSVLVSCVFSDSPTKEDAARDQREAQAVSEHRATQRNSEQLSRARESERSQDNRSLIRAASLTQYSPGFAGFAHMDGSVQAYKTSLDLAARLQPLLQEKLLPRRMTPWARGAMSIHHDTSRSPQQLRALCTVIFMLSEQGSQRPACGQRPRCLKLHPGPSTHTRNYSWRSDRRTKDVPLLHRSRTAYYDILKVSPGATQSQIKTAYYKQSFIYHPDKNPGSMEAGERFSEISEAYSVLGNISLRRKYDRGILSQADIQSAGRPSSKEATSRSTGFQQQQQQRARRFSQTGGKTMFDFDAFYKAHYGEQLQRERDMKKRKEHMKEEQRQNLSRWKQRKMLETTMAMLLAIAGLIYMNL